MTGFDLNHCMGDNLECIQNIWVSLGLENCYISQKNNYHNWSSISDNQCLIPQLGSISNITAFFMYFISDRISLPVWHILILYSN